MVCCSGGRVNALAAVDQSCIILLAGGCVRTGVVEADVSCWHGDAFCIETGPQNVCSLSCSRCSHSSHAVDPAVEAQQAETLPL
jgi:hypothetical protein